MRKLYAKYFHLSTEVVVLALRTGGIATLIGLYYVFTNQIGFSLIFSIIGVFLVGLLEVGGISFKPILRVRYGLLYSVAAGFTTFLGSFLSNISSLVTSIALVVAMWLVGLSSRTLPLIAILILYSANLLAITSGIPAPITLAINYGTHFALGGVIMAISGFIATFFLPKANYQDHRAHPAIFKFDTGTIEYSIRLSIAVCGAYLLAHYFGLLSEQYCAPMTALLISKMEHDFSWQRISHRFFGTLWGSILAVLLILLIHDRILLAILLLPIMFMIIVSLARHYGAYVFFLTAMITVLFNIIHFEGVVVSRDRVIFTSLGIFCAVIVLVIASMIKKYLVPKIYTVNKTCH